MILRDYCEALFLLEVPPGPGDDQIWMGHLHYPTEHLLCIFLATAQLSLGEDEEFFIGSLDEQSTLSEFSDCAERLPVHLPTKILIS